MELSHSIVPFLRQIEQDFEIKQKLNKPEVLNPDGKTLQFRCLAALATKFIDNICIKKTVFRQK